MTSGNNMVRGSRGHCEIETPIPPLPPTRTQNKMPRLERCMWLTRTQRSLASPATRHPGVTDIVWPRRVSLLEQHNPPTPYTLCDVQQPGKICTPFPVFRAMFAGGCISTARLRNLRAWPPESCVTTGRCSCSSAVDGGIVVVGTSVRPHV